MKKSTAVLIPCYNESKTIAKVVSDYRAVLPEADIYVYDNNSTDGTDANRAQGWSNWSARATGREREM